MATTEPGFQRNALLPGIILAAACVAGIPLIASETGSTVIRFIVTIFALIIAVFAVQAGQWWWGIPMAAIAIAWNPVFPFALDGSWWITAHVVAAALGVVAGGLIRSPRSTPR